MILIVDEYPTCGILQRMLQRLGLPTQCLTDGRAALEFMRAVKPSVVVVDEHVPEKSGLEILSEMKSDPRLRDIPVVFFSSVTHGLQRSEALRKGAAGWVAKDKEGWPALIGKVLELTPIPIPAESNPQMFWN